MHLCRCGAIVCASVRGVDRGDVHLGVVSEAVVVKFMTVEDSVDVFSSVYAMNFFGPRTDPCGTPWLD